MQTGLVDGTTIHNASGGGLSLVCLAAHCLMYAGDVSSWRQHLHFACHAVGLISRTWLYDYDLRLAVRIASVSVGLVLNLAPWCCYVRGRSLIRQWNPQLVQRFTTATFHGLFFRGGTVAALYLYFESLACVNSPRLFTFKGKICAANIALTSCEFGVEECEPLAAANTMVLGHCSFCFVFYIAVLEEAEFTLKQILRGLAPLHITVCVMLIAVASLITGPIFAGREFAGAAQKQTYDSLFNVMMVIWFMVFTISVAGHMSWHNQRRTTRVSTTQSASQSQPGGGGAKPATEIEQGTRRSQPI